jgi:hypothetical protein
MKGRNKIMGWTVKQLREELEELQEDAEVRIAFQPNYPMEFTIDDVVIVTLADGTEVVYLSEGKELGYLSGEAREKLDW